LEARLRRWRVRVVKAPVRPRPAQPNAPGHAIVGPRRGVAQSGSAFGWGPKGRWFKSSRPDLAPALQRNVTPRKQRGCCASACPRMHPNVDTTWTRIAGNLEMGGGELPRPCPSPVSIGSHPCVDQGFVNSCPAGPGQSSADLLPERLVRSVQARECVLLVSLRRRIRSLELVKKPHLQRKLWSSPVAALWTSDDVPSVVRLIPAARQARRGGVAAAR
jgi:hypothetical protein